MDFIVLNSLIGIFIFFSSTFSAFSASKKVRLLTYAGVAITLFISLFNFLDGSLFPSLINNAYNSFNKMAWLFLICMDVCFLIFLFLNFNGIEQLKRPLHEQIALLFFIRTGCAIIISYNSLLMLFIGLEIVSIPLYILTGINKKQLKGNEAALKYLLLGSLSTCILLMGITLIYGATGTFFIQNNIGFLTSPNTLFHIGLIFVFISMAFKISAAPFHFWTPDIYEGAPTVYTSFMASIVKSFFVLAFLRLFSADWAVAKQLLSVQILIVIVCTLIIGNFTALYQQGLKRLMAYSSISQIGFMLLGIFGATQYANEGLLLYTLSYTLASISIFYIINTQTNDAIENLKGFGKSHPIIALCFTIYLLSLAGIPFTAGFLSKYFMLFGALKNKVPFLILVVIVISASISIFYYFRLIQNMYFKEKTAQETNYPTIHKGELALLVVNALILIVLGMKPSLLLSFLYY